MGIVRRTKSVNAILHKFETTEDAISVGRLIDAFAHIMNKTTVYRILERLEDDGTLHSFTGKNGITWYAKCHGCTSDKHSDIHPHFQCSDCGKTACLPIDVSVPEVAGHKIDTAELLLTGLCVNCNTQ